MQLSTIRSKWGISSKKSRKSTCLRTFKREGRNIWAVSEGDRPLPTPVDHRRLSKGSASLKNIRSKKVSVDSRVRVTRCQVLTEETKDQGLEKNNLKKKVNHQNHSNSPSCIKTISKIGLEAFSKKTRKATIGQITPFINRSIRLNTSSMRRNVNEGLKSWEKTRKDCKHSEKKKRGDRWTMVPREITKREWPS